jgi:hypothetical protein
MKADFFTSVEDHNDGDAQSEIGSAAHTDDVDDEAKIIKKSLNSSFLFSGLTSLWFAW